MSRSMIIVVVLSLAGCSAATPSSSGTTSTGPSQTPESSITSTSEASPEPTATLAPEPVDVVLLASDVPEGFTLARDVDITIESELADLGPERQAALEERGFVSGLRRGFVLSGSQLSSTAMLFDNPEGARTEFDEVAALYTSSCTDPLDTGGTVGNASASWVCEARGLGVDSASVIFVDGGFVIWVQWRAEGALLPANQAVVVDLARTLAGRLTS